MMLLQVNVVPVSSYTVPEGQRRKPDSRRALKRKEFPPRAVLRAQLERDIAAASVVAT
jgi:hypothetical protein